MLQRDEIISRSVEKFGRLHVVVDDEIAQLQAYGGRVAVGLAPVVHGDDAGTQICSRIGDGFMEIVRERGDAAAPWQMVADERDTLKSFHLLFLRGHAL
jgi:hypothetical protein